MYVDFMQPDDNVSQSNEEQQEACKEVVEFDEEVPKEGLSEYNRGYIAGMDRAMELLRKAYGIHKDDGINHHICEKCFDFLDEHDVDLCTRCKSKVIE